MRRWATSPVGWGEPANPNVWPSGFVGVHCVYPNLRPVSQCVDVVRQHMTPAVSRVQREEVSGAGRVGATSFFTLNAADCGPVGWGETANPNVRPSGFVGFTASAQPPACPIPSPHAETACAPFSTRFRGRRVSGEQAEPSRLLRLRTCSRMKG